MNTVSFYFLEKNIKDNLNVEWIVCEIAAERWRNGNSILIICKNKEQAIFLDKLMWIKPAESFIPHDLAGKGLKNKNNIEIIWLNKYSNRIYDIIINMCIHFNLCIKFMFFLESFNKTIEIIDFIPKELYLKALARKRYKVYRNAGFKIKTLTWNYGKDI